MDETYLITAAKQGDLDAFNRLVLAYQDKAFNLAMRMLSDSDAAEDVTQTAFISAYRNLDSFRGGIFRAWLMRMVTNACYDELRKRKRHPTQSLEPMDDYDEEIESPMWLADDGPSPEESLERRQLSDAINRCLQGLPEDFRAVVVMVDIEGIDYSEVAESIRTPLGTIKSRVARARFKLRDCLRQYWELLPEKMRLES